MLGPPARAGGPGEGGSLEEADTPDKDTFPDAKAETSRRALFPGAPPAVQPPAGPPDGQEAGEDGAGDAAGRKRAHSCLTAESQAGAWCGGPEDVARRAAARRLFGPGPGERAQLDAFFDRAEAEVRGAGGPGVRPLSRPATKHPSDVSHATLAWRPRRNFFLGRARAWHGLGGWK